MKMRLLQRKWKLDLKLINNNEQLRVLINNEMNLEKEISFFQKGGVKETWSQTTIYSSGNTPEHPHLHILQAGEADYGIWTNENRYLPLRL